MPTVRAGDLPYQPYNSEEPSPQVPSAYENIRSTGADFGETIGAATEKLGATIGQGANVLAEGAIARQQLENQVRADDQTNKYQEAVTKILHGDPDNPTDTGFLGKRGENAMQDYNSTYKSIIDLRNTMRGQLANDRQRLSFDNESRRTQILTLSRMGEHYDREFKNYGTAVNTAGATNAMAGAATALAGGRQAEFERQLGENMKFKLKQAELMGTAGNAEVVNSILASTREDAVKMKFLKISETNPYAAKQFLDANTDALKPGEAHVLFKSIEPQWRKIQSAIDNKEMEAPEGWNEPSRSTYDPAHVDTTGIGQGHVAPKAERLAYYKQRAAELGLNYKAVVATVANEGLHTFVGDNGQSFGDFQLYTGGGMGNEAEAAGVNIRDPKYWKEAGDFALKQMAAHKGDAEWFNGQWHGPRDNAPWAANQFGQPDSAPVASRQSPLKIDYAFGDSNAKLTSNHGVPGQEGADFVVGQNPEQIYGRMQARGKEFFAGKTPILSSGTNDPTQVEYIEKSAAFLKDAGVKGMVIPGVGPKVPGGQAAADVLNAQLQGIAQKYGGTFVMPDNWQKDGYHIANVPKFLEKANAALGVGTAETAAPAPTAIPTATGRGAPVTPAQLREGTSGSSAEAEILLADAGGADTIDKKAPIPGMKLAPIPPPDAGEPPDASIPGLTEKIADLASQPWAKENPQRLLDAIKYARTQANARWTESQRTLKLHTEETNAVSEAQKKKYLDRFSREVVPESEILADKSLKSDAQENLVAFQRSLAKGGDPDAATDRANWGKLMKRIIAPYGTEGKITTDTEIINEAIDKNISHASMTNLITYLDKRKTEVGVTAKALKEKAYTLYKPLVEGPGGNMALADPDREARYGNFVLALDKLVDDTQKAGKVDPSTLFTQTDPNDQWSSPVAKLAKSYASPLRPSMEPPPPAAGAPKVFNSPEEVKAEIGKSITYDDALKIISTQFGKPRAAPMQAPPYNGP